MAEPTQPSNDRFTDVKPANALQRFSERSSASRTTTLIVVVIAFLVIAFVVGAVIRSVRNGTNSAPVVPQVDIR